MGWAATAVDRWRLRRYASRVRQGPLPRHVGIVMDGNRRWARAAGHLNPSVGHRVGAEHLDDLLGWCSTRGIDQVTVYVLSADNIRKRPAAEIDYLFGLLESTILDVLARPGEPWRLHVSGERSLLPETTRAAIADVETATADRTSHVTLAVGYDGRQDIADAVRRSVARLQGGHPTVDDITDALGGGPVKDIDLVIRTSGEQRLSGFFPWQSSGADIYSSEKMWPAFTEVDFVRAMTHYAERHSSSEPVVV